MTTLAEADRGLVEVEFGKEDDTRLEDGDKWRRHTPSLPCSYTHSALSNPVILESVFKRLELGWLKTGRLVCRTWELVATPLFHKQGQMLICGELGGLHNLDLLKRIEKGRIGQGWRNYRLESLESSQLASIIDKLSKSVKSLQLRVVGPYGMFSRSLSLPLLESLEVIYSESMSEGREERIRKSGLVLSEIITRAVNIRELKVDASLIDDAGGGVFWESLLRSGGRRTLDKLSIKCYNQMKSESMEGLRRFTLKLIQFSLNVCWRREENGADADADAAALFLFIQDQSSCLETLFLRTRCFLDHAVFLSPMKRLKRLEIVNFEGLKENSVIPLFRQLPVLESLSVCGWNSVFSVVKGIELESDAIFPNLKEFKVDFGLERPSFSSEIETEYCPPYLYVPKFFPNLRKLSFHLFSNYQLLSCIYGLRGILIEELELKLIKILGDSDVEKGNGAEDAAVLPPWGLQIPSFDNWKQLRKLQLQYERIVSLTHVFEIPLESILPKGLTSLEIFVGEKSVFQNCDYDRSHRIGRVDYTFLLNILRGLPLLLQFKVEGICTWTVVDINGNAIKLSFFMEEVRKDPFINPNLSVFFSTRSFDPEDVKESRRETKLHV